MLNMEEEGENSDNVANAVASCENAADAATTPKVTQNIKKREISTKERAETIAKIELRIAGCDIEGHEQEPIG